MRLKDQIKNILHRLPIFPYRKPSKRYRSWNRLREKRFMQAIRSGYAENSPEINAIEVSVVMPACNRAHCINKAIDSVLDQEHENWKLIVVDDGSNDALEEALDLYDEDPRVNFVKREHGGVSAARNTGLDLATGKYVFYLDTDNTWLPGYVKTMITFMEMGRLDAAYSGARIIGDDNLTIGYFGEAFNWKECLELNHIDLNSFAHKRHILDKGPRFDVQLQRLVDWDFILALTANHRTAYAPFLGVVYYDGIKGNRITFNKHTGGDITKVVHYIQKKHQAAVNEAIADDKTIRPRWNKIIKDYQKTGKITSQ